MRERIPSSWQFMGAIFSPGKEGWQRLEDGSSKEIPSQLVVGGKSRPRRRPRAEEGIKRHAYTGRPYLYEEAVVGGEI